MRKVEFEQGSPEWLEWRRSLLTATDAAMLLGLSPYVTPYQGWQRKKGLIPEQVLNAAMERGHRDEPIARDLFIKEYGINMNPCCVESDEFNFIGSSLDGLSDCGRYILEVKSQRPVDQIPDLHMMQMQHQMISTDNLVEKAFYVSHWDGKNTIFIAYPDPEWQKMYIPKAREYWKGVIFYDPPPLMSKDYKNMSQDAKWSQYASEYKKVCEQIKNLEEVKDSLKKELVEMCGENSCSGSGLKVTRRTVKGRVDYEELINTLNIHEDLFPQFRKPSTQQWAIMIER